MAETTDNFWFKRIKQSSLGVTIAAVAGLLVGMAATTDSIDKLSVWVGLKPNALQLAKESEKAQFSRDLTRLAWQRMFSMRRYVLALKENYSEGERSKEWEKYLSVLEIWNRELMVNILSLDQYYGSSKRDEFEGVIQPAFGQLHYCIESLRYPGAKVECKVSASKDVSAIEGAIDKLNGQLYRFVSGLPNKESKSGA
jgi:hypothetical protein